jgi:YHS domain-containing protein
MDYLSLNHMTRAAHERVEIDIADMGMHGVLACVPQDHPRSFCIWSFEGEGPMMARDIVCDMEVDNKQLAARREYRDRTYCFCSLDCLRRFEADPAHYAAPRAAQQDTTHQLTVQPSEHGLCVRQWAEPQT